MLINTTFFKLTSCSNCATISSSSVIRAFFLSRAVWAATRFFSFLNKTITKTRLFREKVILWITYVNYEYSDAAIAYKS